MTSGRPIASTEPYSIRDVHVNVIADMPRMHIFADPAVTTADASGNGVSDAFADGFSVALNSWGILVLGAHYLLCVLAWIVDDLVMASGSHKFVYLAYCMVNALALCTHNVHIFRIASYAFMIAMLYMYDVYPLLVFIGLILNYMFVAAVTHHQITGADMLHAHVREFRRRARS